MRLDAFFDEPSRLEKPSPRQMDLLAAQAIDPLKPGPIVHDFQAMLDFIGAGELAVAGKHNLLPINILQDLNARMHEPFAVRLQRPQLKSYPNLQQLYLLLRATGLGAVRGAGKSATLRLDPAILSSWNGLNDTERYFNLLETFADRGNPEIIGPHAGGFFAFEPIQNWQMTWEGLKTPYGSGTATQPCDREFVRYHADALTMMWLFGLIGIEQGPADKKDGGWHPRRARHTPFGEAIMKLLRNYRLLCIAAGSGMPLAVDGLIDGETFVVDEWEAQDNADETEPTALAPLPLGQMQPLFEKIFPQWKNNLTTPQRPFQEGRFILKVSLTKSVWRRLSISSRDSFDSLADLILKAFKFDYDHLYEFILKDVSGATITLNHPHLQDGTPATDVRLGDAPLAVGDTFIFHYDFGDDWQFEVMVEAIEAIEPAGKKRSKPAILEKHGKAPDQYPDFE